MNDAETLRTMLKVTGVVKFLEQVRNALGEIADPLDENGDPARAYIAINGLDEAIMDAENM